MTGAVLSAGQAALILFGLFFLLMFLRVPVAFALGLLALVIVWPKVSLPLPSLISPEFLR